MLRSLIMLTLAGLLLTGLNGCGDPEETARQRYQLATQVEKDGDLPRAEQLYLKIVAEFPRTTGAASAVRQIERIKLRREQNFKNEFMPVLHRLQRVLDGYRGMHQRYPRRLADLDRGDYLFDSNYLAEMVPEGFVAYLALHDAAGPYRIWALKEGFETGYMLDPSSSALHPVERAELLSLLGSDYRLEADKGRLRFLLGR